ncbi:hypothetical protein FB555_000845 [Alpinimonas psychrophila]|uniref:Disulfide bond formation protein DsbB n=1 Tax=Alpinimonas psychrophila TaxID=748908 RepID=A0A7W3JT55_9MICO|nr:hypothetical protein [Alpinimonas psychrophila]
MTLPASLVLSMRSWILGATSLGLIAVGILRLASISHAGIGESCYQNPGLTAQSLPSGGWTADGVLTLFPVGVRCSYYTTEHSLYLVTTAVSVWDWGLTFAAIAGLLGFVIFLTARFTTRRI